MKAARDPFPATASRPQEANGDAPPSPARTPARGPALYSPASWSDTAPGVAGTAQEPKVMRGLNSSIDTAGRALSALKTGGPAVDKVMHDYFGANGASAQAKKEVGGYTRNALSELSRHRDQRGANIIPYDPKTRGGWQGAGAYVNGDPKHQIHVTPAGMAGIDEPTGRMLLHEATHFSGAKDTHDGYLNYNNPTAQLPEDPVHNADSLAHAMGALAKLAPPGAGTGGAQTAARSQSPEPQPEPRTASPRRSPGLNTATPPTADSDASPRAPSSSQHKMPLAFQPRASQSPRGTGSGSPSADTTQAASGCRPAPRQRSQPTGQSGETGQAEPSQQPAESGASGATQQAPSSAPSQAQGDAAAADVSQGLDAIRQVLSTLLEIPAVKNALQKNPALLAELQKALSSLAPATSEGAAQ